MALLTTMSFCSIGQHEKCPGAEKPQLNGRGEVLDGNQQICDCPCHRQEKPSTHSGFTKLPDTPEERAFFIGTDHFACNCPCHNEEAGKKCNLCTCIMCQGCGGYYKNAEYSKHAETCLGGDPD